MSRYEENRRRVAAPLAAAAVVLCIALNAAPASASGGGTGLDIPERDAAALWLGYNAVIFAGFDVGFLIGWRPTPRPISVLQIVIGGIITPAYALSVEPSTELQIGAYASIAGHIGIGLANLLVYPAFHERRERERKGRDPDPDPAYAWSLEPHADGGLLQFRARL